MIDIQMSKFLTSRCQKIALLEVKNFDTNNIQGRILSY